MIRALLLKEARLQAPFVALVVVFMAIGWLDLLVDSPVERLTSERLTDLIASDDSANAIAYFLLIFSLAVGLLVREIDERTQEWIDALPVSRKQVFLVKVCFAIGVLSLIPLSDGILGAIAFSLNTTSLRQDVPWSWLAGGMLISLTQIVFFFGLGLLLSFLRPFTWIAFGLLFWLHQLAELIDGRAVLIEPFRLGHDYLRSTPVVFPALHCAILWGMTSLFFGLSFWAFVRGEDRGGAQRTPARAKRWALRILGPLTIGLVIATMAYVFGKEDDESPGKVSRPQREIAHARTKYYEMTYPSGLADRARALLARADRTHDTVARLLNVAETATIAVDANGSRRGTAGLASWTKVRLDLSASDDPELLAAVLGHETAHVYVSRLTNEAADQDPSRRFFQEGVATFVEYAAFMDEDQLDSMRLVAALIDQRQQIDFDTLIDEEALTAQYAGEVAYPLGERFFASIAERHGAEKIRALLDVLGDPSFPRQTKRRDRWRIMFQKAGLDLEAEIAAWRAALKADQKRFQVLFQYIPRLLPAIEQDGDRLAFSIEEDVPVPYTLTCRFRKSASSPESSWQYVAVRGARACWIREDVFPKPFEYQLGLIEVGTDRQIWEPWATLH